jgi:hypothetical protein
MRVRAGLDGLPEIFKTPSKHLRPSRRPPGSTLQFVSEAQISTWPISTRRPASGRSHKLLLQNAHRGRHGGRRQVVASKAPFEATPLATPARPACFASDFAGGTGKIARLRSLDKDGPDRALFSRFPSSRSHRAPALKSSERFADATRLKTIALRASVLSSVRARPVNSTSSAAKLDL